MPDHDISYSLGRWITITPSVTGWSSTTTCTLTYIVHGNLVMCYTIVQGTSNATTVTITPPVTPLLTFADFAFRVEDNGSFQTQPGLAELVGGVLNVYKDMGGNAWTASGTKEVSGAFFYQTA